MFKTLKKTLFLCLGGAALMLAPACGDDGGGGNDTPDANVDTPDAEVDEPDAEVPPANFAGTIAVTEVAVSNAEAAAVGGIAGAVMSITYTNPDDVVVAPVPGFENNVGACRIVVYDASSGEAEPPESDAGNIAITGTNSGDFTCAFNSQLGDYLCVTDEASGSGAVTMAGSAASPNGNGTVNVVLGGVVFGNFDPTGTQIQLSGWADDTMNGTFGVVGSAGDNVVVIVNPDLLAPTTLSADSTYATFIGAGPVVGGFDFLDDGTNDVVITKGEEDRSPAVDATLKANGDGVVFMSPRPHEIPVDGSGFSFACTGNCGVAEGALKGIIISGVTTDGDLTDTDFNEMPAPVNSFATFQCSGIAAESIELTQEAMGHILGTNPTRIQTTVTYVGGVTGATNIIVGHGEVGFQDVADPNTPPPK